MALLSDPVFRSTSPDQGYEDSWDWTDKEKTMTQQYVYLPHGAPYPQYHPQAPSYSTASPTSYYAAPNGSSYTNQSNHDPYGTQHRTRYGQQEPAREHSRYGQRPPWRSDGDNHHAYDARERSPVRNSSASRYPTGPHDDREDDRYRRGYRRSPSRDPRDRFPVRDRPLVRDRSPMRDRLSLRERSPIRGRPPARARSPIRGEQERGGKDSKRGRPSVKIVRSTRPRGTDVPRRSDDSSTVTTPVSSSIPPPDQPLQYNKNSQPLGDTRPSTTVSTFNYRHTVSPDRGCKSPPFWYAGQKGMEDLPPAKDEPVIELCCVNCGATVHQTWECSHPPNLRFAERCQAWIEEQLQRRAAWRRHVHLGEPLPPNYDIHPIQPLACDTLQAVIDEIKREDGAMVDSLMDVCDESTSRTLPNNTISAPPRVSSTLTTRIKVEDVPGSPHHLLHTDGSDHRSRDNSVPDQAPDPLLSSHTALPSQPSYPIGPLGSHNGPRSPLSPHRPNPRSLPETDWHLRHSSVPTLRGFRMQDSPALIHFAIDRVDVLNRLAEPAKDDPLFEELSTTDDVGDIPQKLRNNFVIKLHGGEDWTKKGFNLDTLLCEGVLRSRSWAEKKEYEFQGCRSEYCRQTRDHGARAGNRYTCATNVRTILRRGRIRAYEEEFSQLLLRIIQLAGVPQAPSVQDIEVL
ncbi:hypothetical protein CALCODRAFT_166616 [Calocera cornea HHB12733]|uniref:Uncharacterized protein n=1 Tax=Calocera cornea HHB12733 TaxID=1353952 RepID=A0A165HXP6_9BASI|nr:hypothetical protein CALCODRAFT_166616 [Calocera cornea HHB12733]